MPDTIPDAAVGAAPTSDGPAPARPRFDPRQRTWRLAGLGIVAVGVLALAYDLRAILNPILLSLGIAYVLSPIVDWLERHRVRRTVSIICLYFTLLLSITIIMLVAVPATFAQVQSLFGMAFRGDQFDDANHNSKWDPTEALSRDWNGNRKFDTSFLDRGIAMLGDTVREWNVKYPERKIDSETIYGQLEEWARAHAGGLTETSFDVGGTVAATLKTGLASAWSLLSYLLLVPVYVFFFLLGMNHIRDALFRYLPGKHRDRLIGLLGRIHLAVSAFFRGKLMICLFKGLFTFVGLWLAGVKFPLVFGFLQTFGSLIPFVPLVICAVPAEFVVFMDVGMQWWPLLATAGVFLMAEVLEGFVLTPLVLGKETGLHPLTLIVSLLIMGELFGFFGVLLAVPLASIVKILGAEFLLPPLEALAHEQPDPEEAG